MRKSFMFRKTWNVSIPEVLLSALICLGCNGSKKAQSPISNLHFKDNQEALSTLDAKPELVAIKPVLVATPNFLLQSPLAFAHSRPATIRE
jgi:hypothetical protein